ncbi:MAG: hypothetical protein ACM3QS_18865 [Bacteroidota bacterium]
MPTNRTMLDSLIAWFKRRFQNRAPLDPAMQVMLRSLAMTQEGEISCDQVYAVLDEFAEAAARGENMLIFMPLVRQHLNMCPDCREEYETLLRILQPEI